MSRFITLRKVALASLVAVTAMISASQAQAGHGFGGGNGFNKGFGNQGNGNHGFGNKGFGNSGFGGKGFGSNGFGGHHFGFPSHKFHGNFGFAPPVIIPHKNHFHFAPGHFH